MTAEDFGYALGTVLAGFIFMVPLWAVSRTWVRFIGPKDANPWLFTMMGVFVLSMLGIYGATLENHGFGEWTVIALGMIPVNVWCLLRFKRFRRLKSTTESL
jgi:hypothetical protein